MGLKQQRRTELAKYVLAYQSPKYHLKGRRYADAARDLATLPCRGAYLDVSCGRGELLNIAAALGFGPVQGTEIVPALIDGGRVIQAWAHALPFEDRSFDVVTFLDVMEHLLPGDDERACRELARVARRYIMVTVSNLPSTNRRGDDLHINKRPYDEWAELFRVWFAPHAVRRIPGDGRKSEGFVVEIQP